ncbi:ribosome associated membrane protein RAMP4 (macronuclear) [Tetrahymena thermophila SB210]|uniref:Ribosome associated membrane protein RAMP4 n=1 Tax=Tetrahymena thermophila (strain SB210) TaxID=312017 RepID=W7XET8_TETTS|nr:ribosome associated membrane protein RAMP4 [Tetrahymena thermophila SB210]EWS72456.1 ribosome associated membrane protein RAMP4 [Tetrahymena thermophila SB210]|eukprot:XP_012655001.1 ribosome associated membrane protein RAMP4 [Tetrahymena thermophila SB210]
MTSATRSIKHRNQQFSENITKRGQSSISGKPVPKEKSSKVGPVITSLFIFVVVGSAVFQLLNMFLNTSS